MRRVIVLSGRVCSGKTTLAEKLEEGKHGELIKTRSLLKNLYPRTKNTRLAFQRLGQRLDNNTNGQWLSDELNRLVMKDLIAPLAIIDSVRISAQVQALRDSGWKVFHVHLEASQKTLENRYKNRLQDGEFASYRDVYRNRTESHVDKMRDVADVVIDTDRCQTGDIFARVVARIENRPLIAQPLVDVLVGGQYGSEGKGNIAHYLAPEYDVLVRVGGPNAGHKVYRVNQDPYTFRQLPSGTLASNETILVVGAGAVISLETILKEIAELDISHDRLLVDPNAIIIDPEDIKWEEQNLKSAIGSTAQGIGRATARKILNRIPEQCPTLAKDILELRPFIKDTVEFFAGRLSSGSKILLEGTQGTSLSLHHGHYPHVTSRATTSSACLAEAGLSPRHVRKVVMVCRTYPIRVGNSVVGKTSGFMSQEISLSEIAQRSGIPLGELISLERGSVSGRARRVAEFDWAQFRRSLLLNGSTDIALTFADYFSLENRKAFRFEQLNDETLRFIEELEKVSGIPVSIISTEFSARNIIDRRSW